MGNQTLGETGWLPFHSLIVHARLPRRVTAAGWYLPPLWRIHLSIGQVYAFSVFKNPLLALHGADGSQWNLKEIGYIFSIAIAFLGLSAALFGKWLETAGPRKAMFVAACCFGLGFEIAAAGASTHQLWLIYLGYGVIGGIGLGLGYISPVSTLIKWFPDRPGLATGMAIMGFGGGAMIGSPLGTHLMAFFKAWRHPAIPAHVGHHGHPLFHLHDVRRLHHPRPSRMAGSLPAGRRRRSTPP